MQSVPGFWVVLTVIYSAVVFLPGTHPERTPSLWSVFNLNTCKQY